MTKNRKRILPTCWYFNQKFKYNPSTGELIRRVGPRKGKPAVNADGKVFIQGRYFLPSRVILRMTTREFENRHLTFYKDGNPKNLKLENLGFKKRPPLPKHIRRSPPPPRPPVGMSGYRGVTPVPATGKWMAYVRWKHHHIHLGCFVDVAEAAAAAHAKREEFGLPH